MMNADEIEQIRRMAEADEKTWRDYPADLAEWSMRAGRYRLIALNLLVEIEQEELFERGEG